MDKKSRLEGFSSKIDAIADQTGIPRRLILGGGIASATIIAYHLIMGESNIEQSIREEKELEEHNQKIAIEKMEQERLLQEKIKHFQDGGFFVFIYDNRYMVNNDNTQLVQKGGEYIIIETDGHTHPFSDFEIIVTKEVE